MLFSDIDGSLFSEYFILVVGKINILIMSLFSLQLNVLLILVFDDFEIHLVTCFVVQFLTQQSQST